MNDLFSLKTDDNNFDYKFTVKFLDNGKSLNENYREALEKGSKQIVKLLIDNKIVKHLDIENITRFFEEREFTIRLYNLSKSKYDPYQVFIEKIFQKFINKDCYNELEDGIEMKLDYFNQIIYTKDTVSVKLPTFF